MAYNYEYPTILKDPIVEPQHSLRTSGDENPSVSIQPQANAGSPLSVSVEGEVGPLNASDAASGETLTGALTDTNVEGSSSETPGSTSTGKPIFPRPAEPPTQEAPCGVRFDFNDGCRVVLPEGEQPWRVRLSDLDTGNVLYETQIKAGRVNSAKRYFVRVRIEIWRSDANVFTHDYSAAGREVLINFPVGTLGDTVGWFPYAVKFQALRGCRLTCAMAAPLIALFQGAYPEIEFVKHDEVRPERYYAAYNMGLFFDDKACVHQPCDFRFVGLHRTAGYILGVDPTEVAPRIALADESRPMQDPYVCIATQSTTQAKYWNNPNGWREIIRFLKDAGYKVVCIDQKAAHGVGLVWNHIPNGAEDQTGLPLQDCARWLRHAEFFIGLSSGLSWLAWAAGAPVVMISGFSHPTTEFATPYRVINYHTCNGCWNDPALRFDHKDFLWCPRHKDTPRQFECTRLITVKQVKGAICKLLQSHD